MATQIASSTFHARNRRGSSAIIRTITKKEELLKTTYQNGPRYKHFRRGCRQIGKISEMEQPYENTSNVGMTKKKKKKLISGWH